jgi:hypothetical protein
MAFHHPGYGAAAPAPPDLVDGWRWRHPSFGDGSLTRGSFALMRGSDLRRANTRSSSTAHIHSPAAAPACIELAGLAHAGTVIEDVAQPGNAPSPVSAE